jgi:hypothetical protein
MNYFKELKKFIMVVIVTAFTLGSASFDVTAGNTETNEADPSECWYDDEGGCDSGGWMGCTDCDEDAFEKIGDDLR